MTPSAPATSRRGAPRQPPRQGYIKRAFLPVRRACVPNPLQINRFRPEVELSGGGNLFVAFRRAASRAAHGRRHPRGAAARARGLRGPSPPHTHAPQLLRYRIGAYGRGATRVPLRTIFF